MRSARGRYSTSRSRNQHMPSYPLGRYFRTLVRLRPVQISNRIYRKVFQPRPNSAPAPSRREVVCQLHEGPEPAASYFPERRFRFLNVEREVRDAGDWNNPQWDALWLYNLHYFDDLRAKGAQARRGYHQRLLMRWIAENPPGKGVGWDPYPTSVRIVNWIRWVLRFELRSAEILDSIAIQLRWLEKRIEYHLLGNHLLVNAKALIIGGMFFEGSEADRWRQTGGRILRREVERQVLADGGHCERSAMYHRLILEDLLDVANVCNAYDSKVFEWLVSAIERMLRWSAIIRHPDGQIPFFNDATLNVAAAHGELERYATAVGFTPSIVDRRAGILLKESGFARLDIGNAVLLTDVGTVGPPYQPGHAHAGTLSFEFSLFTRRLFVNSGVSTYTANQTRMCERGTKAHNTVCLDDQDSSEVWASFRVGRRAKVLSVKLSENRATRLTAAHNGYRYLPGKPIHWRTWVLDSDFLKITDRVDGRGEHEMEIYYHFHPDVTKIEECEEGATELLVRLGEASIRIVLDPNCTWRLERGAFSPEFGIRQRNLVLIGRYKKLIPARIDVQIHW